MYNNYRRKPKEMANQYRTTDKHESTLMTEYTYVENILENLLSNLLKLYLKLHTIDDNIFLFFEQFGILIIPQSVELPSQALSAPIRCFLNIEN